MSANNRPYQMEIVQKEALALFKKKNHDYGDAFATYGTIGVLVRLGDKIKRLMNISNTSVTMVNDEKMRDTLIDLHNYAAMAIMLIDEQPDNNIVDKHYLAEFIKDKIVVDTDGIIKKQELYNEFKEWYTQNYGRTIPKAKEVEEYINKKCCKFNIKLKCWKGIKIFYDNE